MCCSLVSSTNGPKTLPGTRMHQGGPGCLRANPIMTSETFWRSMQGLFKWRWTGCMCTAATSPQASPPKHIRDRSLSLKKYSERLLSGSSFGVTSMESHPRGLKSG